MRKKLLIFLIMVLVVLIVPVFASTNEPTKIQEIGLPLNSSNWNWVRLNPPSSPSERRGHAMVFNPEFQKVILFGGKDSQGHVLNDTWVFDFLTNSWTKRNPLNPPPPREGHTMIYDSASSRVILFGGYNPSLGYLNDTWAYDYATNSWINLNPDLRPTPRRNSAMAYYWGYNLIFLFGGRDAGGDLGDFWAYNITGNGWSLHIYSTSPSPRSRHAMVYDSTNGRAILFGGANQNLGSFNDTWAYNFQALTWTHLFPSNSPTARYGHGMVFDPIDRKVILFGGINDLTGFLNDTWIFDYPSNSWTQLSTSTIPTARDDFGIAFDSFNRKVIIFGGYYSHGNMNDTWALSLPESSTPFLALTFPNGGESWRIGTTRNISWTSNNITGNVKIELNRDYPSGSWETLFPSTPNDGSQSWVVTGPVSSRCRIRISSVNNPSISDLSDLNFDIKLPPSLTLTSPNGGESWTIGSTHNINWTSTGVNGDVKIELNRNYPSGTWEALFVSAFNDGSQGWQVTGPESTACRMRISSVIDPTISDVSNANFAIISPPALSITPTFLDFGSILESLSLTVRNSGGGTLSWLASESLPWLSLSPTSGNLGSGQSQEVSASVSRSGLSPGLYSGEIFFNSNAGLWIVPVSMNVPPQHSVAITSGPFASPSIIASGGTTNLSVSASDSLGHSLTYSWSVYASSIGSGSFSNPGIQNPTWTAPQNLTGVNQTVTLKVRASCSVDSSKYAEGTVNVTVEPISFPTLTLHLNSGWNLISLPVSTDPDPKVVFSGLPTWRMFSWNPITKSYLDKNHSTLEIGKGFWLWVPNAVDYQISGTPNTSPSTEIPLYSGWNMIGTPYNQAIPWDSVQVRRGSETVSLNQAVLNEWLRGYAYYWESNSYRMLRSGGSFQPLYGYWFYAKVDGCTMVFLKP